MELIEYGEHQLAIAAGFLKLLLEIIAVFCVFLGLLGTLKLTIWQFRHDRRNIFARVRLRFGSWLALALEFQLGADILSTTVAPSFQALGKLGAIALIRSFLNYFLTKELEAERRDRDRRQQ